MMLRSSSMIRSAKSQRSTCPVSMRMVSPSASAAVVAHRRFADEDRPVRLEHLQLADLVFVIALDFQQHLAAACPGERRISSSSSKPGLFETRYSLLCALSWNRPPSARALRRRSASDSSDAFVKQYFVLQRRPRRARPPAARRR